MEEVHKELLECSVQPVLPVPEVQLEVLELLDCQALVLLPVPRGQLDGQGWLVWRAGLDSLALLALLDSLEPLEAPDQQDQVECPVTRVDVDKMDQLVSLDQQVLKDSPDPSVCPDLSVLLVVLVRVVPQDQLEHLD